MDFYNHTYPKARKAHKCEYCGKEISKDEKYSYEKGKYDGEMFTRKLCLTCLNILTEYCNDGEFDWKDIDEWLHDEFCYDCDKKEDCEIYEPQCSMIRKKFKPEEKNNPSHPRIYAVDFDGTLCEDIYPDIGKPNMDMINSLIKCRQQGDKLILWTCRVGEQLQAAVEWCKDHGLEFDAINENLPEVIEMYGTDARKVNADVYIDDKAANIDNVHGS